MWDPLSVTLSWLDEIDMVPDASPLVMGIRALGDRAWLIVDGDFDADLAEKMRLCRDRHGDVFGGDARSREAGQAVVDLVRAEDRRVIDDPLLHPLDRAGRSIQEDLCLMHRRANGWCLAAASLCFPSRWRLQDKMDRHITQVHRPVDGYDSKLAKRLDGLFERLSEQPVWRRNWFVHPDPALFQPDRPANGDPVIPAAQAADGLFVRSERQTLRVLPGLDDWILFTIRVQQATVAEMVHDPARRAALQSYLSLAPSATLTHRGMAEPQVTELQRLLR